MSQGFRSPGKPFRRPTNFSLSIVFGTNQERAVASLDGRWPDSKLWVSDKLKFVGRLIAHQRVSLEFLVAVESWCFDELGPDESHRFLVTAAAVIFVGDEIGEARIDARKSAHALLGPIEGLIVFPCLSIDFG